MLLAENKSLKDGFCWGPAGRIPPEVLDFNENEEQWNTYDSPHTDQKMKPWQNNPMVIINSTPVHHPESFQPPPECTRLHLVIKDSSRWWWFRKQRVRCAVRRVCYILCHICTVLPSDAIGFVNVVTSWAWRPVRVWNKQTFSSLRCFNVHRRKILHFCRLGI